LNKEAILYIKLIIWSW